MGNVVKHALEICIQEPSIVRAMLARSQPCVAVFNGVVAASSRPEAIAACFKAGFPAGLQGIFDYRLCHTIFYGGNAQRSELSPGFGDVDTPGRLSLPQRVICHLLHQLYPLSWGEGDLPIKASGLLALALLGDVPYSHKQVGVTAEHQLRKAAHLIPLPVLCCPIYPLPQVLDPLSSTSPIYGGPCVVGSRRSDVCDSIFHVGAVPLQQSTGEDLREVCRLAAWGKA